MLRLIHISDLHFSNLGGKLEFVDAVAAELAGMQPNFGPIKHLDHILFGRHSDDLALNVADFIHSKLGDHHALLISGDLAARGLRSDLNKAREYIFADPQVNKGYFTPFRAPTLNTSDRAVILLPGNHDRFGTLFGTAGGTAFDEVFGSHWQGGANSVQSIKVDTPEGVSISFVCADFCLDSSVASSPPGPPYSWGQGKCLQDTIDSLVTKTARIRLNDKDRGIVWVSHFPPSADHRKVDSMLELVDFDLLSNAATTCGVEYILTGHLHEPSLYPAKGSNVISVGSACVINCPNGNWINSIEFAVHNSNVSVSKMESSKWDRAAGSFLTYRVI